MHEFSIVDSLIQRVHEECKRAGFSKVKNIKIVVGKASGALPAALLFAFHILKEGTLANESSLIIEETFLTGRCNNCNYIFQTEERFLFSCPNCFSNSFEIISGNELNIVEIEVY
ncbi:MAG: hydrogenase maturation nickel metallochaperone HypA [Thermodesulfovibrionales bacterium]|nr:hydrogenase maturation nickel metallochaperone HypA [Thermodesulfovibrionales bacterium]